MSYFSGPYRIATVLTVLCALLYAGTIVFGFNLGVLAYVGVGLLFLMLSGGLSRARRGMVWLGFFIAAIGAIFALAQIWAISTVPATWWLALAVTQAVTWASLFVALWKSPPVAA